MARLLTKQEIHERMVEWRNLKHLHRVARERIEVQDILIKEQADEIRLLKEQNMLQKKLIETLTIRVEELERMVFGRKKRKDHDQADDDPSSFSFSQERTSRNPSSYHRRVPPAKEITHEQTHTIDTCPECHTPLTRIKIIIFYEEDILLPKNPSSFKAVTKRIVEKGFCNRCVTWHPALPIPPTLVVIGPNTKSFVSYASVILRLSYDQIQHILNDLYAFPLSQGEIANILQGEATKLTRAYERLKQIIREQSGVHYDETGWKVQKEQQGNYAWVATGTDTPDAVFLIGRSRGKGNAEELKGDNSLHIGITDDYGAYRMIFKEHQLCWAHPLRKLRDLAQSDALDQETRRHCRVAYEQFAVLYQDIRGELIVPFDHARRKTARDTFITRLNGIAVPSPRDPRKLAVIKESLKKNMDSYFICLLHEGIPPDNNKAERALRHLVLKRKISFGSATQKGADTLGVLASVLLSLWWKKPDNFFQEYMALRGV
ncbi:MAG: IS66 family transposase [Patescibacteria group bacterium]